MEVQTKNYEIAVALMHGGEVPNLQNPELQKFKSKICNLLQILIIFRFKWSSVFKLTKNISGKPI